jgi:tripartite-type tricarboxylate transporter receptor subunit TctC
MNKIAALSSPSHSPRPPPRRLPDKPIKWIVPYTPGGITDSVTRLVTQKLQEALGQPVVIENKPGANSQIGADLVAKSPPDGYTFLTVIAAHAANATLYAGKLPFDTTKSFAPVSLAAIAPLILTVTNNFLREGHEGAHRLRQGEPGQDLLRVERRGRRRAPHHGAAQADGRHPHGHVPYKGTARR